MKNIGLLILILSIIFLFACSCGALKKEEIPNWLLRISTGEAPEIDASGKWYDAKGNYIFGWGEGYLRQDKDHIYGAIGNYIVEGRVSGKKVYLVFLSGGKVYYTARLEMFEDDTLRGSYFDADDKEQSGGYPTSFARKKE